MTATEVEPLAWSPLVFVPPKAKLPSDHPVVAHALEFNCPLVVGLGEKPAPENADGGFVPTVEGVLELKSIVTEFDAFVKLTCPHAHPPIPIHNNPAKKYRITYS